MIEVGPSGFHLLFHKLQGKALALKAEAVLKAKAIPDQGGLASIRRKEEGLLTHRVEEWDAGLHENKRPSIGVTPRDGGRGVDHGGDALFHKRTRCYRIQVLMSDKGDIAGA